MTTFWKKHVFCNIIVYLCNTQNFSTEKIDQILTKKTMFLAGNNTKKKWKKGLFWLGSRLQGGSRESIFYCFFRFSIDSGGNYWFFFVIFKKIFFSKKKHFCKFCKNFSMWRQFAANRRSGDQPQIDLKCVEK